MPVRDDYVREETMQVGGTPLRVVIRPGTRTGPPLLLCNGIGMRWKPCSRSWMHSTRPSR